MKKGYCLSQSYCGLKLIAVTPITELRSRVCDTHVVNMVRKASKKAFLEPGDTKWQRKGEAAVNFVCIGIASGRALPTSRADHWYPLGYLVTYKRLRGED